MREERHKLCIGLATDRMEVIAGTYACAYPYLHICASTDARANARILYNIILCQDIKYYVMLSCSMLCHVLLFYCMLFYSMTYLFNLSYVMYITLYHTVLYRCCGAYHVASEYEQ